MNTYYKYAPNVFLAKCEESYQKGDIIEVETKYGKENECIVYNLIAEKGGFFYYSIIRADGINAQEWAKRKAERYANAAINSQRRGEKYFDASSKDREFLSLGEPIKVGHHSENRHRRIIEQANNNMRKCIEADKKAEEQKQRAEYWESMTSKINLSMPESIEYYRHKLEKARAHHTELIEDKTKRSHSYSLTYAKKEVNEAENNLKLAIKLWG